MSGNGEPLDRRAALARFGLFAMLPSLMAGGEALAQASPSAFIPPAGPALFTRRLVRELPGGAAITVTRLFKLRFLRNAAGYAVEGTQLSAQVSAPPILANLARVEEQRQETGLFPLQLDESGRIIAGPGGAAVGDFLNAVDEAFAWLARQPITRQDRAQAQEFVIGLQTIAARITTAMPVDLFTGQALPLDRSQPLTMPDGKPGMVKVAYSSSAPKGATVLSSAERIVTTDAGGAQLRSIEQWTLEPMPTTASR